MGNRSVNKVTRKRKRLSELREHMRNIRVPKRAKQDNQLENPGTSITTLTPTGASLPNSTDTDPSRNEETAATIVENKIASSGLDSTFQLAENMNDGRDVMVHAVCAVNGCFSSSRLECCQHLSWHRIPGDKRKDSWLRAIGRPDLAEKSKLQLTNSYVCSLHFEPWLFKKGQKKKKLPFAALPTLNPVPTLTFEGFKEHDVASVDENSSTNESSVDADQSKEEKEEPDDVLPPEEPEIKQEIEDSISEHEEDIIEKLNRKRELETDPLETGPLDSDPVTDLNKRVKKRTNTSKSLLRSTKSILTFPRIKLKMPEQSTSTMLRPIEENGSLPVDFMKSIMNSQNEILTVLKSQVLLQNPDPDLLPFLRFVGAKLSYLDQSKRKEIQNAIIDFLNNS